MTRERFSEDDALSPREWEILDMLREGVPARGIAQQLGIARTSAEREVAGVLAKVGISGRGPVVHGRGGLAAVLATMSRESRQDFLRNGAVVLMGMSFALFALVTIAFFAYGYVDF